MRISLRGFGKANPFVSARPGKTRKGFVIVEIIVAMVLLAIAISSLAALLYSLLSAYLNIGKAKIVN